MVDERKAQQIAEEFIWKQWGVHQKAVRVTFRDATARQARIASLAKPGEAEIARKLEAECRDLWSVMFSTVLCDGTVLDDPTFVDVDAITGEAAFFE